MAKASGGNGGNGGSGGGQSMERQLVVGRLRRIAEMADDARFGRGVFDLLAGYQVELRWEAHTAVARVVNTHAAYDVVVNPDTWEHSCTCPDYVQRMKPCKHIVAMCLVAQAKLAEKSSWEKFAEERAAAPDPQARMAEVQQKFQQACQPQPQASGRQPRPASRQVQPQAPGRQPHASQQQRRARA